MTLADQWALLGIAPTDDRRAIRLAYTERLKEIDVDSDPAAFVRLREAMEAGLQWGTQTPYWEDQEEEEDGSWDEGAGDEVALGLALSAVGEEAAGELWNDEFDPERWRPELPAGDDSLGRNVAKLDGLLFEEDAPDPEQVAALGEAILSDPELINVDRAASTEEWLAQSIAASAPRSDPLIEPVIRRYRWDQARRDWRRNHHVERVLERREALAFLRRCEAEHFVHRAALRELKRPARRRLEWDNLDLAGSVGDFLKLVDSLYPSIHSDLDPDSVKWWRDYLRGPHLPANFWPLVLMIPLTLSLFAAFGSWRTGGNPIAALLFYPVFMLVAYAGILLVSRIQAKVRRRADEYWMVERTPTVSLALMALALALPPAVAVAGDTRFVGLGAGVLAPLIGIAMWWRTLGAGMGFLGRTGFLPGVAGACALLLVLAVPEQIFFRLLVPFAMLCALAYWCGDEVQMALFGRKARLAAIAASILIALAAATMLVRHIPAWPPPPWALALVPVAIIATHLATSASLVHLAEWPLRMCAVALYFVSGAFAIERLGADLLIAVFAYGLVYCLVKLLLAAREALRGSDEILA